MKDIKDSYPVQLAEFAIQNKLQDEPAFAWWVKYAIKKKNRIIAKIKSKYWEKTHKYGIRIPKSVKEALEIDAENEAAGIEVPKWWDAIMKEMKNVRIAFKEYEGDVKGMVGYQKVRCHIIHHV